jgi:hypothetical protein
MMIWEHFTYRTDIEVMRHDTDKLLAYIAKNLRSIASLGIEMAGYCGTGGIGSAAPNHLEGQPAEDAMRIARLEVALSHLTTHLGMACSAGGAIG